MADCITLALDISMHSTGYALFKNGSYLRSGVLKCDENKQSDERLYTMSKLILDRIGAWEPDIVVVEQSVMTCNADTFRKLSVLIGVVFGNCIVRDADFYQFTPSEWRSLISKEKKPRKREELKQWDLEQANRLMTNHIVVTSDDEADAILIGQAYMNLWKE